MEGLEDSSSVIDGRVMGEGGPTEPRRASSLRARLRAWADALDSNEHLIVLSLLALCVLVRVLWLEPVNTFWDAGAKWHFVRQWSYSNEFGQAHWSHHMARFGINVPAYLARLLLGGSARVYYVAPVALFTLGTLFAYLTARRLAGLWAGVLAALFMTFFTGMTSTASQLLPDGVVGSVAMIGGYAFVRFHEAEGKARIHWLLAVAAACIWAYATKESSVMLFPGFGLAVLLSRRSIREAAVLVAVLAGYGLLETACFRAFTPYAHRLAVVGEEHGLYPPMTFWQLFGRFAALDPPFRLLFWAWCFSVAYDLVWGDQRKRLFLLLPFCFVFCLTFGIRRLDPIVLWESFKPRYMAPAGPLFVVSVTVAAVTGFQRLTAPWWARPTWVRARELATQHAALAIFGGCLVLGVGSYLRARPNLDRHPLVQLRRDASVLNDAFRRNLPIVEDAANPRSLNTVYAVYMRAEYLAQSNLAKDGRLPDIQEAVRFLDRRKKHAYILRDDSAYAKGELQALIDAGCAIKLRAAHRTVLLKPREKLPESCKAPRGEPLPRINDSIL